MTRTLNDAIADARYEAAMTQKAVAEAVGMSTSGVALAEYGKRRVNAKMTDYWLGRGLITEEDLALPNLPFPRKRGKQC